MARGAPKAFQGASRGTPAGHWKWMALKKPKCKVPEPSDVFNIYNMNIMQHMGSVFTQTFNITQGGCQNMSCDLLCVVSPVDVFA